LAAAELLVAQVPIRVIGALGVTTLQLGLILLLYGTRRAPPLVVVYLLYVAVQCAIVLVLRARRRAPSWFVTTALATDFAYIFATTVAGTTPAHYDRALLGMLAMVQVANFFLGRRQAIRLLIIGTIGYLAMTVIASRYLTLDVLEELWSLTISVVASALMILHAGNVRERLRTIVDLFERAEEGDFSEEYDEAADLRSDPITRVGRAYNRVRLQLGSMVLTDPLTGCLNRRGFDQALARELARASRAGSELALLAIDLDHFKLVNDSFGHLAGDAVLRATGELLRQAARAGDVVARVGGEEFALLLADTGSQGAFLFASRLCDMVRVHPFESDAGVPLVITTSVGVAAGTPDQQLDVASLLWARADAALYAAKRSGRDRVRAWTTEIGVEHTENAASDRAAARRRAIIGS
jgi:diguanylate cyclase (GGDEF)-like protein